MKLFLLQEWVVDSTIIDYEEFLVVQLTNKISLIPVRFYVQLEGTKNINKFKKRNLIQSQILNKRVYLIG